MLDLLLVKRRAKLQVLIERHDHPNVLFSAAFDNPLRLLAACEERRLEGIVSKRTDAPYGSGNASDWVKVKCAGSREAHRERWRLFEKTANAGNQALRQERSFRRAFELARQLIADWEAEDGLKPSLPQIAGGEALIDID